jgi:hypothetical protein
MTETLILRGDALRKAARVVAQRHNAYLCVDTAPDPVAPVGRGRQGQAIAVDGNGGTMQPQDYQGSPPVTDDDAAPSGPPAEVSPEPDPEAHAKAEPVAPSDTDARPEAPTVAEPDVSPSTPTSPEKAAKRPVIPVAAFDRVPRRWLIVAGAAVLVVVVALAAVLLSGPAKPRTSAAPGPNGAGTNGASTNGPGASGAPGVGSSATPGSPGSTNAPGPGPGSANGGNPGTPPASVEALRTLLIDPPTAESTVDLSGADDTTIEGARWGVSLFWTNPEGSVVLTEFGTADQARNALTQYRAGIHDTGICTESTVSGRADAFLCTPKDLGEGVNPGDLPAIGLGLKGTIVALVTVSDPATVQHLLGRQLDRLP